MAQAVRIGVLQMTSGIHPQANVATVVDAIGKAASEHATMLFTPEMSGLVDRNRERARSHITDEEHDQFLAAVRKAAAANEIWVAIGSIAVTHPNGKNANRSLLIDPRGEVVARYDKIHLFDVDLSTGESWRESNAYQGGDTVVTAATPAGKLGLTVCYDLRFPALYSALGDLGCDIIAVPSAFTVPTGEAHWHVLLRARAIEASAFVVAAAQCGKHEDARSTYGHSLVVDPWGEVLLDMGGEGPGLGFAEIDPTRIQEVRAQLPSLANRRDVSQMARQ